MKQSGKNIEKNNKRKAEVGEKADRICMKELRFRQVHLDFHTSPLIENIGKDFAKENFIEALQIGHVDSITVFSKCHHGYAYHPTAVHQMHPHLNFDLLGEQLSALKAAGIASPVYLSAGLDEKEALNHPEWLVRNSDESTTWVPDFIGEAGFHLLCYNSGYLDLLVAQIEEVMIRYNPAAIFLDISSVHPCYCANCRNTLLREGRDPRNLQDIMALAETVYANYCQRTRAIIDKYNPQTSLFHNSGHISRGRRDLVNYNSHLELESLPTGGWGYDHFPMSAAYATTLGKDFLGMTGKFHTSWGEFGGFKHPNALLYETSLSLAFGAKCSIGDQLHPLGELNLGTYDLIGQAYKVLEAKESWCQRGELVADIGLLSSEACQSEPVGKDKQNLADIGANRILLEGKYLYKIIDTQADFEAFSLLILPDDIALDKELSKKLKQYLRKGGKILATGQSGLAKGKAAFALDFGVDFLGENSNCPNYLRPCFPLRNGMNAYVMYQPSYRVRDRGAEILGYQEDSYFNRSTYAFCSHQHSPNNPDKLAPGIFRNQNTLYCSWKIFSDYAEKGSLHLKETIFYLIDYLLGEEKTLTIALPDRGIVTLQKQPEDRRLVVHLLFAYTSLRGKGIEVIEDQVPLYQIPLEIKLMEKPKSVYLAPEKQRLDYQYQEGRLTCTIPQLFIHQMVVVEL